MSEVRSTVPGPKAPVNGAPKKARTRKPVTVRTVADKVASALSALPADQRDKALSLAGAMLAAEG